MIKVLKVFYKCYNCGNEFVSEREFVVDEYISEIKINQQKRCLCESRDKPRIVDIKIEEYSPVNKANNETNHS